LEGTAIVFPERSGSSSRAEGRKQAGATERVVDALREAIVTMEFAPGTTLDKAVLTARFGVSRFPISEALNRLKAEGLVDIRQQSGSSVSLIRLADARENMFLRRALESETVALLAETPSPALLVELDRNLRYQETAMLADDRPGFHRLDLAFRDLLIAAVGYQRVRGLVESARLSLDRVRRLLISPRRHAETFAEHQAIVAAIRAGDRLAARMAMGAHIDAVMLELEAFSRANPQVFADVPAPVDAP
jgi:DNA-binding GntR family transcriptional regulator